MVGSEPVTLLALIDRLPATLYDWVIEQTLVALDVGLRPSEARGALETVTGGDEDSPVVDGKRLAEVRDLLVELVRLVHASDVVAARLGLDGPASGRADQTALERVRSSVAA